MKLVGARITIPAVWKKMKGQMNQYIIGPYQNVVEQAKEFWARPSAGNGTLDGLAAEDIDYTTNKVPIEGGNHAQFGNYGSQKRDLAATISSQEQQSQTVTAVAEFIKQRNKAQSEYIES